MERIRKSLSKWPPAILSAITVLIILWLTLAPKPLGDDPPQLFPGADKIVHALMFGFLTAMMLLDWQRINNWKKVSWGMSILYGVAVSFFGIFIECAQNLMGLGRGFDWWDILADVTGAFLVAIIWMLSQHFWININKE